VQPRNLAHHRVVLLVLLLSLLAGCDSVSGVNRSVTLHRLPSRASVEAALRAVPEIEHVGYQQIKPTTVLSTAEGVIHDPPYDMFTYLGDGTGGTVVVRETEKGSKTLELSYLKIGGSLPRSFINRTRTLMDRVYTSLRSHAPEIPPATEVHEDLIRVRED